MFKSPRMRMIFAFLFLTWLILFTFYFQRKSVRTIPVKNVLYASPSGGTVAEQKKQYQTVPLRDALREVKPGQTVFLFPGTYAGPFEIEKVATEALPISISAISAVLNGDGSFSKDSGFCLRVNNSQWVFIDGLSFQNCWASSVLIENSQNIFIHENEFRDSRYAIAALGEGTRNLVLENNRWNQDPSGRMWTEHAWADLHHGALSHFNGAFFASFGISGDVVIRKNQVQNAFNAVRMKGDAERIESVNANVQIYENTFERVRDNVFEPEVSAYNWWIHHNRIRNAHAWFSIDDVAGGYFYIFGNVGRNDEPYGKEGDHTGGAVFKLTEKGSFPTFPIYIFHNTWLFEKTYIRANTTTRHIRHFNNILLAQTDAPDIVTEGNWHESYRFDYDLMNFQLPAFMAKRELEKNSLQQEPQFTNAAAGDFSLQKNSPAVDRGVSLKFAGWASEYYGDAPDIGAFEGKFPVKGPPFQKK